MAASRPFRCLLSPYDTLSRGTCNPAGWASSYWIAYTELAGGGDFEKEEWIFGGASWRLSHHHVLFREAYATWVLRPTLTAPRDGECFRMIRDVVRRAYSDGEAHPCRGPSSEAPPVPLLRQAWDRPFEAKACSR